jgi:hypothetical protein
MGVLKRYLVAGTLALAVTSPAAAQGPQPTRGPILNVTAASETRQELRELFRRYPPSLAQVLRLDPTLLANDNYLQTYPELRAYLKQHPEIPRAPEYFLSFANLPYDFQPPTPDERMWRRVEGVLIFVGAVTAATIAAILLLWLIRHLLSHRRWLRAMRIQTELQNKLIERLTTSEDVRSYLQTAGATKLLTEVPSMAESSPAAAPATRILRSVQMGATFLVTGVGIFIAANSFGYGEVAWLGNVGSIAGGVSLALGLGFLAAAVASYLVSKRLGLLPSAIDVANDRA